MELEELKSTWTAVDKSLARISRQNIGDVNDIAMSKRRDAKDRLLRFEYIGISCIFVGLVAMATSPLWSPALFPSGWCVAFCCVIVVGIVLELYMVRCIKAVDICNQSGTVIIRGMIRIKKLRRNIEILLYVPVIGMFVWLSESAINLPDRLAIWGVLLFAVICDYIIYKRHVAVYDELIRWSAEDTAADKN